MNRDFFLELVEDADQHTAEHSSQESSIYTQDQQSRDGGQGNLDQQPHQGGERHVEIDRNHLLDRLHTLLPAQRLLHPTHRYLLERLGAARVVQGLQYLIGNIPNISMRVLKALNQVIDPALLS